METDHSHTPEAIRRRLAHGPTVSYLRDWVYGGMAAANYSANRADAEDYRRLRGVERRHVRVYPEGERQEIREIFRNKGFEGAPLEEMVTLITDRPELWIDTMLAEEYGRSNVEVDPRRTAGATFASFVLCGSVPLLPFVLGLPEAPMVATGLTGAVFFAIGAQPLVDAPLGAVRAGDVRDRAGRRRRRVRGGRRAGVAVLRARRGGGQRRRKRLAPALASASSTSARSDGVSVWARG